MVYCSISAPGAVVVPRKAENMLKNIALGKQSLALLSNGATPIRYKMTFKNDLMVELNQMNNGKKDEAEVIDLVSRLAYVMANQAKALESGNRAIIAALSFDNYIEWLEDFEPMDFIHAAKDVINMYLGQTEGESKPKKGEGRQTEK